MCARILLSPWSNTLVLKLSGSLDLSATRMFASAAELVDALRCDCVVDLAEVSEVYDSGVSLLLMLRHRLGDDASIRMINCEPSVMSRLNRIGLDEQLRAA